jgi:flagellar hook-basal body complex protein FliE
MDIREVSSASIPGLSRLQSGAEAVQRTGVAENGENTGPSFSQALESLTQSQANSDDLLQRLAAGEDVDLHQVMITAEEADINFRVALAIRDRLVDAYREVIRMAV